MRLFAATPDSQTIWEIPAPEVRCRARICARYEAEIEKHTGECQGHGSRALRQGEEEPRRLVNTKNILCLCC